jgi:hypothetical protein
MFLPFVGIALFTQAMFRKAVKPLAVAAVAKAAPVRETR